MQLSRVRMATPRRAVSSPTSSKTDLLATAELTDFPVLPFTGGVYGPPLSGKSHLLATAQEFELTSPALILTFDLRDVTLSKFRRTGLRYIQVPILARKQNKSTIDTMELLVKEIESKPFPYKFLGLDGASKMHKPYVMRDIIKAEVAKDKANRYKKDDPTKWHDPDLPEQRDYGRATEISFDWMERLRTVAIQKGFSFIMTFRERTYEEELANGNFLTTHVPDLPPALRTLMEYEFDFLFRLVGEEKTFSEAVVVGGHRRRKSGGKRFLVSFYTRPTDSVDAKDRYLAVPDGTQDLDVKQLYGYFKKGAVDSRAEQPEGIVRTSDIDLEGIEDGGEESAL